MKRHTFTLVELLVVVGIIALLAGLIIPAVGMAQTSARRTACLSNQGQVMKIMRTFMNEGDKQFLPNSLATNGYWARALYEKNRLQNDLTVARCPSIQVSAAASPNQKQEILPDDTDAQKNAKCKETYGMIFGTATDGGIDFKSTKSLKSIGYGSHFTVAPNQMTVGGCVARVANEQVVARALTDFGAKGADTNDDIGRPALVHADQTNMFFLDGHAESFTRKSARSRYWVAYGTSGRQAVKVGDYTDGDSAKSRQDPTTDDQRKTKDWMLDPDWAE
ncbi:MAG: type II secretion system protein [Lentisphaerae bacterium]|nr:type II secretion system protein [Lentisphaerota bacterium]